MQDKIKKGDEKLKEIEKNKLLKLEESKIKALEKEKDFEKLR
jgi:hypothetical protein